MQYTVIYLFVASKNGMVIEVLLFLE